MDLEPHVFLRTLCARSFAQDSFAQTFQDPASTLLRALDAELKVQVQLGFEKQNGVDLFCIVLSVYLFYPNQYSYLVFYLNQYLILGFGKQSHYEERT